MEQALLNAICYGESNVGPQELLHKLKSIESELGRPLDYEKWSPRIIDLDIILFNNININEVDLTIPHPELKTGHFYYIYFR